MSIEAMKQALEALDIVKIHFTQNRHVNEAITALRTAIEAAEKQVPVACVQDLDEVKRKHLVYEKGMDWEDPLYTSQPAAQPPTHTIQATGTEALVCQDIAKRQAFGLNKYGVSVADNPLAFRQWLQHSYEERLDDLVYLRRAMQEMDKEQSE